MNRLGRLRWWQLALVWLAVPVAVLGAIAIEAARRDFAFFMLIPLHPADPGTWPRGVRSLWANGFEYMAAAVVVAPALALVLTLLAVLARRRGQSKEPGAAAV